MMGLYIKAKKKNKAEDFRIDFSTKSGFSKISKRKTLDDMNKKELRDKLDRAFSDYIRMSAADDNGYVCCPTCGRIYFWNETDCSHFIHRDVMSLRWDERNVIAQCQHENRMKGGNIHKMIDVLIERHGEEEIKKIKQIAEIYGKRWQDDEFSLREKIKTYREKNKKLKKEKGL